MGEEISVKQVGEAAFTSETKCSHCRGSLCCQYVTQKIDTPRSIRDFDHLLWSLSHLNTQVYKDEDGWFLVFNQPCQHLGKNGGCNIYENRPLVCREHDNHHCEFDQDHEDFCDLYFHNYEELDDYCQKRFKNWKKRFQKY